jgi:S-formylglutathione hydrolase FrmB
VSVRRAAFAAACVLLAGCGAGGRPEPTATPAPAPATSTPVAGAAATVIAERRAGPRLVDLRVRSRALGTTARVRLLTPAGWRGSRGTRRWPVLVLLHGCCDSYRSWSHFTDIARLPALRRVLVVMPEGGAVGFYSDWRDGPGWETFHTRELPALLAARFGAGPRRAIAGLSMGGLGALDYAARHPGAFAAAASFSGLLHPLGDAGWIVGLLSANTPDPDAVWGDPREDRATWAAHDPAELAARLRGTALFVAAGDGRPGPLDPAGARRDLIEPVVEGESRAFVARARAAGVPVRSDFYGPGTHRWPYWQRELHRALPLLLAGLRG